MFSPLRLKFPYLTVIFALAGLGMSPAWAVDPFNVQDIKVEGLQRTDPGTVFTSLPFRVGETYTDEKGAQALRSLFATGLFKDVRVDIDGSVVVVTVEERPVIAALSFIGLKEFDKDTLTKALKDAGVGEGMPFDRALIDRAEQEIKRQYLSKSLYAAEVVTTVTPAERNRVNITFTMNEGATAKIREIRIAGAQAFAEERIKSLMDLSEGTWLSWYTKSDRYAKAKLNADLETIRAFYVNRGYLEFAVESAQVSISPSKQDISVAISIKEGQPYTVTAVKLEGNFLGKDDEFRRRVKIAAGKPYKADDVTATTKSFTDLFAQYGYAFARVEARPDIDRATGQVKLTLQADPARRVYVRRIEVAGNQRTRDEVVRRELRQFEAAWYDGAKIKVSKDRIQRLGFFKDVSIETREVPGTADQVDLVVNVEERATGNLSVGAGYSSAEKLTFAFGLRQENVFGTGNSLGIDVNTSKINRALSISTVDPYFTQDGVSRHFDIYYRTSRLVNSTVSTEFQLANPGVALKFGLPFSDIDTVFVGLGLDETQIHSTNLLPQAYLDHQALFGKNSLAVPLTLGWQRDERDSVLAPTEGRLLRTNFDLSLAGDLKYGKADLQAQQYFPVTQRFTLGLNAGLGWGVGLSGNPYPVTKNFFGGGLGTVRAFQQGSLGLVDTGTATNTGAFLGGPKRLNLNAEFMAPLPGAGNDKTLRWFVFTDVGNVWKSGDSVDLNSLRASAGLGLSWLSPVGPLRLSYGGALRKLTGDKLQPFQFQIGTAF